MNAVRLTTTIFGTAAMLFAASVNAQTLTQPVDTYQQTQSTQSGTPLKKALVDKMIKANEAEMELAKMAKDQTDNSDVRQFAEMLIEDHKECNEKLKESCEDRSNEQTYTSTSGHSMTEDTVMVPEQLCKIGEEACDNMLKMTKEMLSKYEGQDFTMAYLGQQCVAHTAMLAELKAIESEGPKSLQSVVQPAIAKCKQHLEKAHSLAKKYEDASEDSDS